VQRCCSTFGVAVFFVGEQGWTDVMYALMDAEVNAVAAIFSVSIIVVIAFLGIQLFTSALCTSSMQVRWVLPEPVPYMPPVV
jgi:hypothetical protein